MGDDPTLFDCNECGGIYTIDQRQGRVDWEREGIVVHCSQCGRGFLMKVRLEEIRT